MARKNVAQVRALNDSLRLNGIGGEIYFTQGIMALSEEQRSEIVGAIRSFDDFHEKNDPYGEHDCAMIRVGGLQILWKIDYYDANREYLSTDPSDPNLTVRVMTIMLTDEY